MAMRKPKNFVPKEDKPQLTTQHFRNYQTKGFYSVLDLDENQKSRTKFIQTIEAFVRTSFEYKNYISYLKTEANLTYCSLMGSISEEVLGDLSIEIHHYPFTLYDIVDTVLSKQICENLPFTRMSIANEVMELHYSMKVGMVPLTLTAHQLAHTGSILINPKHVFGDFNALMKDYRIYMSDEVKERFNFHINSTKNLELVKAQNQMILETNEQLFISNDDNKLGDIDEDF